MSAQQAQSNIQKTFSAISVDEVKPHAYKDQVDSAQLRQVVTTTYPSMSVGNSLSDSLFEIDEFGLPAGQSYEAIRVTWLDVPKGTTKEQVESLLQNLPNARIYATYSNNLEDVMTAQQKAAVEQGLQTIEFFEDKLRIRDSKGNELPGVPQYRQYGFSKTAKADIDLRTVKNSNTQVGAVAVESGQSLLGG